MIEAIKGLLILHFEGFNCESSSFRHDVVEIFTLQACYEKLVGGWLTTFRDSLSVSSSRDLDSLTLENGDNRPLWNGDNELTTNQCCVTSPKSKGLLVTVDVEYISGCGNCVKVGCIADNAEKCSIVLCRVILLTSDVKTKPKCISERSVSPFTFTRCQHPKIGKANVKIVHMKIQLTLNDNNATE